MFPGQETPSPSCTLYLSARSPIFIRLYLRLESVPLHFLSRSSSSSHPHPPSPTYAGSSSWLCVHSPPAVYLAARRRCCGGGDNMQTFPGIFAIRMPPKPPPVREEPPSAAYPLHSRVCICTHIYIYIQVAILLAGGKISSSLLQYEEKSARWNVSFFTPFSQVFFTGCSFEKGREFGVIVGEIFFDSLVGLEVRSGARLEIY